MKKKNLDFNIDFKPKSKRKRKRRPKLTDVDPPHGGRPPSNRPKTKPKSKSINKKEIKNIKYSSSWKTKRNEEKSRKSKDIDVSKLRKRDYYPNKREYPRDKSPKKQGEYKTADYSKFRNTYTPYKPKKGGDFSKFKPSKPKPNRNRKVYKSNKKIDYSKFKPSISTPNIIKKVYKSNTKSDFSKFKKITPIKIASSPSKSVPSQKTGKTLSTHTRAKIVRSKAMKSIGDLLAMMNVSSNLSRSEKNQINTSVKRIFGMIDFLISKNMTNEAYLDCIKEKLGEIKDFLKKLEDSDWKIGLYIRDHDFHDDFVPESVLEVGSPKLLDALLSFEDFVNQCNKLKG